MNIFHELKKLHSDITFLKNSEKNIHVSNILSSLVLAYIEYFTRLHLL